MVRIGVRMRVRIKVRIRVRIRVRVRVRVLGHGQVMDELECLRPAIAAHCLGLGRFFVF